MQPKPTIMKKTLFLIVLVALFSLQASHCQEANSFKAVYKKGVLKVFNQKNKVVEEIKVSATKDFRIEQKTIHGIYFYAFYKDAYVSPDYVGLCDVSSGKWIFKLNSTKDKNLMIPNISFLGSCHHNSYFLFVGGTGPEIGNIQVLNKSGELNHSDMYYANFKEPEWNKARTTIDYYKMAKTYPKSLPKFKDSNNAWLRKYMWVKGKVNDTDDYEQTFVL